MPEQNVEYMLEIVDELPTRTRVGGGGGGASPFEPRLEQIKESGKHGHITSKNKEGHCFLIARYAKPTAATAAKNVLQQRHGRTASVEGFTFQTRRLPDNPEMAGLFVAYDPSKIVPGAADEHAKAEAERLAALADKRSTRESAQKEGLQKAAQAGADKATSRRKSA